MKTRKSYANLPAEVREHIVLLDDKSSGAVSSYWHVDASSAMQRLAASIDRARPTLDAKQMQVVQAFPFRWHARNLKRYRNLRYSDQTVHAAATVLSSATLGYLSRLSGVSVDRKGKDYRRIRKFIKSCTDTLVSFCLTADPISWRHVVSYLRGVSKGVGEDLGEFLTADALGENYDRIRDGLAGAIELTARKGQPEELELLFASIPGHELRDQMTQVLNKLLSEKAAQLQFSMQEAITGLVGLRRERIRPEYVSPAESPQITRLAAFLLGLWDSVQANPAARQLFEEFQHLCQTEFKLFLRGDVGVETQFDARVHEGEPSPTGKVRIVRPWVESFDPPRAQIVIRALVEALE